MVQPQLGITAIREEHRSRSARTLILQQGNTDVSPHAAVNHTRAKMGTDGEAGGGGMREQDRRTDEVSAAAEL